MARLTDVPAVLQKVGAVPFARRVWTEVIEDELFTWASALAYSWLFAVFPFMIFLLTLVPNLPAAVQERAEAEVNRLLYEVLPAPAADSVWNNCSANVHNLLHRKQGKALPRLVGLIFAIWAASGGMAVTMSALDKCYDLDKGRAFYRQRIVAVGLTLLTAALLLMVVSLLPVGSLVRDWLIHTGRLVARSPALLLFDALRFALAITFLFSLLALIYHFGPAVRHRFVAMTPGSLFSVSVWLLLGLLFRFYVVHWGRYNETYGAVGGVAVLLLFFYIDALVLLVGAEIDSEVDFAILHVRRGGRDFSCAADPGCDPPESI